MYDMPLSLGYKPRRQTWVVLPRTKIGNMFRRISERTAQVQCSITQTTSRSIVNGHCQTDFHTLKYLLVEHVVEDWKRFGSLDVLYALASGRYNVPINGAHTKGSHSLSS